MARRWTREHEEAKNRILALMSREAMPFADRSPQAVAARKAMPFAEWCHTYLPHWFSVADAPFHEEADARRNVRGLPMCDCWARGLGGHVHAHGLSFREYRRRFNLPADAPMLCKEGRYKLGHNWGKNSFAQRRTAE